MLERARSLVCSRSTSLRLLVTCEERVPAEKRAMKSLSWAIFFSRWAFCDSRVERFEREELEVTERNGVVYSHPSDKNKNKNVARVGRPDFF